MKNFTRIRGLRVGDQFPVGGVLRTVHSITDHQDDTFDVLYKPGTGMLRVSGDIRIFGVNPSISAPEEQTGD